MVWSVNRTKNKGHRIWDDLMPSVIWTNWHYDTLCFSIIVSIFLSKSSIWLSKLSWCFWNCCIEFKILSWCSSILCMRLRVSSCLIEIFFCKIYTNQLITAPTTAPNTMLRYVLDAFVMSIQSFVISGIHPQTARIWNNIVGRYSFLNLIIYSSFLIGFRIPSS